MGYTNIRDELCPRVHDQILAMANPETGIAQVKATELPALMNCHRYNRVQISKAISYLIADKKLEFIADNGPSGIKVRLPELCKSNTVIKKIEQNGQVMTDTQQSVTIDKTGVHTHPAGSLVEIEKERFGLKKADELPKITSSNSARSPLEEATMNAEYVLSDSGDMVAKILQEYMRTRRALDALAKAVRNSNGRT